MQFYLPLVKADQEKHLIYARAAAEEPDKAKEIMDYASAVPMFKAWSKQYEDATGGKSFGNVRAMHNPKHLAGKVEKMDYDDDGKCVGALIKILDPTDWIKVEEGGYTGISIGGGYAKKWPDPLLKGYTRYTPRITEISLVDSPCITSAVFLELQKIDGTIEEILLKGVPRTFEQLVAPRTFDDLNKANLGAIARGLGRLALAPSRATAKLGAAAGGMAGIKIAARRAVKNGGDLASQGEQVHRGMRTGAVIGRAGGRLIGLGATAAGGAELLSRKKDPAELDALKQQILGNLAKAGVADLSQAKQEILRTMAKVEILGNMAKAASPEEKAKIEQTMHEFKHGGLRSYRGVNEKGKPRRGPKVTDRKQAIAIALNQASRLGKSADGAFIMAIADGLSKAA